MSTAETMFEALCTAQRVLLSGPVAPDGDSIGACLALAAALESRGVCVVVAGRVPMRFAWMPGVQRMIPDGHLDGDFDAVTILDGDCLRLEPPVERRFRSASVKAIVDHHASTDAAHYTHPWLEPQAESTCGMLYRAFCRWDLPVDATMAEVLYTGLVFDTGGFRHPNTTPETMRIAAELLDRGIDHATITARTLSLRTPSALHVMGTILAQARFSLDGRLCVGCVPDALRQSLGRGGDLEGVVDALLHTSGTSVAALLVERGDGTVKLSLRSRSEVDVAALAKSIHPIGGGHSKAAGATVRGSLARAEQLLYDALAARFSEP